MPPKFAGIPVEEKTPKPMFAGIPVVDEIQKPAGPPPPSIFQNMVGGAKKTMQNIGQVLPAIETAANLATSAYGIPASGLAGLAGLPFGKGKEFVEATQKALIYPPQTPGGKQLTEAATYPIQKLEQGAGAAGGAIERSGYPKLGAAVHTGIMAAPLALPLLRGKGLSAAAIEGQIEKTVKTGINKSIRPSVSGRRTNAQVQRYNQNAVSAVKDIVENKPNLQLVAEDGSIVKGKTPSNLSEMSQAIEQTKGKIFNEYDAIQEQAGKTGAVVDLNPIVTELRNIAADKIVNDLNPEFSKYANGLAEQLETRGTYTTAEAQTAIATLNNRLESFYKNPSYENSSKASIDSVIANNLRKSLDTVIENATGTEYQTLKNKYGALKTIERDTTRRTIVDARKNIKGLIDFFDIFSASDVVHGIVSMNPAYIARGFVKKGMTDIYKKLKDPNRIIKNMFEDVEKLLVGKPKLPPSITMPILPKLGEIREEND